MDDKERMRFLNSIVESTGVEFEDNDYMKGGNTITYQGDYAQDLSKSMVDDSLFDKMNVDWNHVKKVMDRSDEKYGTPCNSQTNTTKNLTEDKKKEKMLKIVELMMEVMKDE